MPVLIAVHKHTRILKPFENSEPTGLKVDIAGQTHEIAAMPQNEAFSCVCQQVQQ